MPSSFDSPFIPFDALRTGFESLRTNGESKGSPRTDREE